MRPSPQSRTGSGSVGEGRTVVVLAAGEGKRMKSALPKLLHPLLGRTLQGHVLAAARSLEPERMLVVVGHEAAAVTAHVGDVAPEASAVLQPVQRGTGQAARIALEAAGVLEGTVVIINGDVPLLRSQTLTALMEAHESAGVAASILTAEVANPYGLGRIIRNPATGGVYAI